MLKSSFCVFILISHLHLEAASFVEVFGWKQVDYENRGNGMPLNTADLLKPNDFLFPSDDVDDFIKMSKSALNEPSYIPYNNVPMGVNHYKDRVFITMPRRRPGIPSTLNYIDLKKVGSDRSPKLTAYPDFTTNALTPGRSPNDNRIVSVYRTKIDACNRLWFIDTGLLEYPNNRTQVQQPSIWVIDLETNRRVHRFEIPSSVVGMGNGLVSITVDVDKNSCKQAYAYITDMANNVLYVYSFEQDRLWTFRHNFFYFDPTKGQFNIAGQKFAWRDGIFSVALGNRQPDNSRTAYFHPMASTNEFAVSTKILQTESNAARSYHDEDFKFLGSRGSEKQSTIHAFDPKTESIFYAEVMKYGVGCWNTKKEFSPQNHGQVSSDARNMIYPSDLTIDDEGNIWVVTNSIPIFIYSQLNTNEINFRVWKQSASEAVKNTVCEN